MKKTDSTALKQKAQSAVKLLKSLANSSRLLVLCELIQESKNVTELVRVTELSQPHVSQLLARFKDEGVVKSERKGKEVYYSLHNECVQEIIEALWKEFCRDQRRKP